MKNEFKIAAFYRFETLSGLTGLRDRLLGIMESHCVFGTIIIAAEGFNATVSAREGEMDSFLYELSGVLGTLPECKITGHDGPGFERRKVKIKKEIVTFKKPVDIGLGTGTHVSADDWDDIIKDPRTVLIDARNDYEFKVGSFRGALNPQTESFSEVPEYIEARLTPGENPRIAMFCTGGIRCEKLAPYLVEKGFSEVFQLEGGILSYLAATKNRSGLWQGECFVFDERITVDDTLRKGSANDFSVLKQSSRKPGDNIG